MKPPRKPIHRRHRHLQTRRHNATESFTRLKRYLARRERRALDVLRSDGLRVSVWIAALPGLEAREHGRGLAAEFDGPGDEAEHDFADGVVDA